MKAIVQDRYGPIDALEYKDVDEPVAGDDEVLVRVHAAGVDPGVWHLTTGLPYLLRVLGFGLRGPKVRVRGMDVAGRVEAVGKNVTSFKPGDEVYGACDGSFAEYARARQDMIAPKPSNLTFEQAAAVPVSGCSALQALRDRGRVRPGQKVLVIGAAGGVGTYAVQLAKASGAHVTGVCSTTKTDLVRSIGADDVVDYTRDDFADGARRYDLILDTAGNRSLSRLRRALTPRGTLVLVGGEGEGRWFGGVDRLLRALLLSPFVRQRLRGLFATTRRTDLESLTELIEAGKVAPVLDRTYALSEAREAIGEVAKGRARGKTVITVRD
ncbi:NAD(P)-dependent alcohol dehydrogenase [Nonomuraea lactucae]|uniref:NAD(P)-dependent alcohol dehydrogenase n=1 Tax=Nonomuraea lactucae TaxID=2249762 RepID=UPI000DE4922C|nr:NAD(P)-dependent alcohol dehydrogenase [Nonomuraea lactucae]